MSVRIGSLFSGYGGLDMAVQAVLGGEFAWHCQYDPEDRHQYAARILAHHWPKVPNLGDITGVCWGCVLEQYGPVDVLTGGFPCTDLSLAGKRAGIAEGTRSGLWLHMARAIEALRPRLVVIENVRGILSQQADRGVEPRAEDLDRTGGAKLVLRALGAVLGDLAGLGLDAEWEGVQAAEVGAPHERFREFIIAWPRDAAADADDQGTQRAGQARRAEERHTAGPGCQLADAEGEGQQGDRVRRRAARGGAAAQDTDGAARGERRVAAPGQEEARGARADARGRSRASAAGRRGGAAAADADRSGLEGNSERDGRSDGGHLDGARGMDADRRDVQRSAVEPDCPTCGCPESFHDAGGFCAGCHHCADPDLGRPGEAAADAEGDGRREGRAEPARQQGRSDAAERGGEAAADTDGDAVRQQSVAEPGRGGTAVPGRDRPRAAADADGGGRDADERDVPEGQPDIEWGDYADAIARWEAATGRTAPRPTDDRGRLSAEFVEWMMGLPAGHVTGVPGLPRSAQLKALGNGVVPLQAAAALQHLLDRAQVRVTT